MSSSVTKSCRNTPSGIDARILDSPAQGLRLRCWRRTRTKAPTEHIDIRCWLILRTGNGSCCVVFAIGPLKPLQLDNNPCWVIKRSLKWKIYSSHCVNMFKPYNCLFSSYKTLLYNINNIIKDVLIEVNLFRRYYQSNFISFSVLSILRIQKQTWNELPVNVISVLRNYIFVRKKLYDGWGLDQNLTNCINII